MSSPNEDFAKRCEEVRATFIEKRGWWGDGWEAILKIDPDFIEAYGHIGSVPSGHGYLDPKSREFVNIALDVSVTHLYLPGLRRHIRNALRLGATRQQVMEVIELASLIGLHAAAVGGPILAEEADSLDSEIARGETPALDAWHTSTRSIHPE